MWLLVRGGAVNDDVDVGNPYMIVELGMSFITILNTKLTACSSVSIALKCK